MSEEYKYVWLNVKDGTFSNSWEHSDDMEELEKESAPPDKNSKWKLIKYCCKTDEDFNFDRYMRLV